MSWACRKITRRVKANYRLPISDPYKSFCVFGQFPLYFYVVVWLLNFDLICWGLDLLTRRDSYAFREACGVLVSACGCAGMVSVVSATVFGSLLGIWGL